MAMFRAFKPEGLNKIAKAMGYQGDMKEFGTFLEENPDKQEQMQRYTNTAMRMAQGGLAFQQGGTPPRLELTTPASPRPVIQGQTGMINMPVTGRPVAPTGAVYRPQQSQVPTQQQPQGTLKGESIQRMYNPGLPAGGVTMASLTPAGPAQDIQTGTGELTSQVRVDPTLANVAQAGMVDTTQANKFDAAQTSEGVKTAVEAVQAAQVDPNDPRAKITAAQQTASSVGNLEAAQGQATIIESPVQRQIQAGELISTGSANAEKASAFTEQIQAATATPTEKATVQGQLAQLTANFDATNPPSWAAGAIRGVQAAMAQRGLGASSMAGQAMVQAAIESALPIAQADAQVTAQFEAQNLSNRQQRAMLSAQQRATFIGQEFTQDFQMRVQNAAKIGDIANQNFTAEQQIQLENSRLVNSMNLNNLSNRQAIVVAEASALANMDLSNLNNRQQAAVQNAQNFLQMDMQNLSNRQQTNMFKNQQVVQSLFTDQAATNASRQFNATSQNQTDQFFAGLANQVGQFNASQANATAQYNAGQANTVNRFNAEINDQRDQFNAQNALVIAQSNAQWRRQIATADTAAVNRANELNANAVLDISKTAYDNLWQNYKDVMEFAWKSAESQLDRLNNLALAELNADASTQAAKLQSSSAAGMAVGGLVGTLGSAALEFGLGNLCWVAREVYGPTNPKWIVFRQWMDKKAPKWLLHLYSKHGKQFAEFIKDKPTLKFIVRKLMDLVINKTQRSYKYGFDVRNEPC